MKRKFMIYFLVLALLISIFPTTAALANTTGYSTEYELYDDYVVISEWAIADLVIGDTYGIYPMLWYLDGLTGHITNSQMRVLLAGLRHKILNTNQVVKSTDDQLILMNSTMTVEEVLKAMFTLLSSYTFTKDLGLGSNAVNFMKSKGIFTGTGYEQGIKDICTMEQACVFATRLITYLYNELDAASKGFMWEIEHEGNKVYLMGSIHIADTSIYPFSKTIWDAFQSSDALVVEVNMLEMNPFAILEYGIYTDGTTLKDHVSEECYNKTMQVLTMLGLPTEEFAMFKPWLLWNMLSTLGSTDMDIDMADSLGIDNTFMYQALLEDKPILEIEGYELQIRVFDGFSNGLQELLLNQVVDAYLWMFDEDYIEDPSQEPLLNIWLRQWREGDVEGFKRDYNIRDQFLSIFGENPTEEQNAYIEEFVDALLTQRDIGMADYIEYLLQNGIENTFFVVVGSAHYISDYSVIDILIDRGYKVTLVK